MRTFWNRTSPGIKSDCGEVKSLMHNHLRDILLNIDESDSSDSSNSAFVMSQVFHLHGCIEFFKTLAGHFEEDCEDENQFLALAAVNGAIAEDETQLKFISQKISRF